MNLVELERVKLHADKLQKGDSLLQSTAVVFSKTSRLMIMRQVPMDGSAPLYLASFTYMGKTLNKNKQQNVELFVQYVGEESHEYLELLVSLDRERHYNKGSGITYLGLSFTQVRRLFVLLYRHNKRLFPGG